MSVQLVLSGLMKLFGMVTNMDSQNLVYAMCIFLAYPLALFYRKFLTHSTLKHMFSIVVGLIFCTHLFNVTDIAQIILSCMVTLIVSMYFPLEWKPDIIVFSFCLLQLSILHIYRMMTYWMSWTVDVTGVMMLLTIKMTSFAFDYVENRKNGKVTNIGLIEWLGYIFFFPSLLTGPTTSFEDYIKYVNNPVETDLELRETRRTTFNASLYLVVIVLLGMRLFPLRFLYSDEFWSYPFLYKLVYAYVCMLSIRCKYYFAWTLAKASCLAAGLSIEASTNIKIYEVEFAQNPREVMTNWNICSSNWLKTHVYTRLIRSGTSTSIATFSTNMVSAIWHGFYPGYYLTFLMGGLLTEIAKVIRRNVSPYFSKGILHFIYETFATLCTTMCIMYFSIPFQVYGFRESFVAWYNLYFFGHMLMAIGGFIALVCPKSKNEKNDNDNFVTMSPLDSIIQLENDIVENSESEEPEGKIVEEIVEENGEENVEENVEVEENVHKQSPKSGELASSETSTSESIDTTGDVSGESIVSDALRNSSKRYLHHLVKNGQKTQDLQTYALREEQEDKKNV